MTDKNWNRMLSRSDIKSAYYDGIFTMMEAVFHLMDTNMEHVDAAVEYLVGADNRDECIARLKKQWKGK